MAVNIELTRIWAFSDSKQNTAIKGNETVDGYILPSYGPLRMKTTIESRTAFLEADGEELKAIL